LKKTYSILLFTAGPDSRKNQEANRPGNPDLEQPGIFNNRSHTIVQVFKPYNLLLSCCSCINSSPNPWSIH